MALLLQAHHEDLIKLDLEMPLKKNKFDDYPLHQYNLQFPLFALEPMYMQYMQDHCLGMSRSAFKPFVQNMKENCKIRHGSFNNFAADQPPVLQHPKKVVSLAQTEQFEGGYQPNVALAPPAPKKHRYMKLAESYNNNNNNSNQKEDAYPSNEVTSSVQKSDGNAPTRTVIKHEKYADLDDSPRNQVIQKSPDSQSVIDSTVSVVQSTGKLARYNSEIELSTDTDDSASETSEKQHADLYKIEELLKDASGDAKEAIVGIFKTILKEKEDCCLEARRKDNKITDLEARVAELEQRLREYECSTKSNSKSKSTSKSKSKSKVEENQSSSSSDEGCQDSALVQLVLASSPPPSPPCPLLLQPESVIDNKSTPTATCDNNNEGGDGQQNHVVVENSSSIFYENCNDDDDEDEDKDEDEDEDANNLLLEPEQNKDNNQTSVIATVEKQQADTAIIKNEPE